METAQASQSAAPVARGSRRKLFGIIFLHGFNDMHSTSLPTIIPMLAQSIGLTLGQAGMLNALFGLTNIFGQPVTGYFADRLKHPWFAVWGPLLSICGAALLPLAPSYGTAFIFVGMMSVGTALFHPQGSGSCGAAAGQAKLAYYLSLFQASGGLGSSLGPIYVVVMISMFGRAGFPLIVIPAGAAVCFFIWKNIGRGTEKLVKEIGANPERNIFRNLRELLSKIGWIVSITSVRDATYQSIKIFLPTLFIMRGGSIAMGGAMLFGITLAGTLAGIAGGRLADRFGDVKVLLWALGIAPVFLLMGLISEGAVSLAALMVGFAFSQASTPITNAMSQKRCPEMRSLASSLSMGVSWGLANLFVTPVGIVADQIGLAPTLYAVAVMPWLVFAWYGIRKLTVRC